MKLNINDYHSADIDDVWDWAPENPSDVYYQLEFEIVEPGIKGGVLFQLNVATSEGLISFTHEYGERLPKQNLLMLDVYSWDAVLEKLNSIVGNCTCETWEESLACLRKHFVWEYEGR